MFCHYTLTNPEEIDDAIDHNEPLPLWVPNGHSYQINLEIPSKAKPDDGDFLRRCLGKRQDHDVCLILMKKILAVLRWKYAQQKARDRSREVLDEFAECLRGSAEVQL